MGGAHSVPKIKALEVKRVSAGQNGWLCKRGLNNTALQRRWCAIHEMNLYYYDNPRSEEPNGVVHLQGAMVNKSQRFRMALEIETGALVNVPGVERRVYVFTTQSSEHKPAGNLVAAMPTLQQKKKEREREQKSLDQWIKWLQEASAKTFVN